MKKIKYLLFLTFFLSTAYAAPTWKKISGTNFKCPVGYIYVSKLSNYTYKDFCVAKYEMKSDIYGQATSESASTPTVTIARAAARSKCQNLGYGYDLISNDQWQTIARSIADVASNWSSGTVYSGEINRGHSDNSPANSLVASSDDEAGNCINTGESCSISTWHSQRRTHTLSNGNIIWDFSGNVSEWVTNDNTAVITTNDYVSNFSSGVTQTKYGNDQFCASPSSTPYCGFGQALVNYSLGGIIRGGAYNDATDVPGIFFTSLNVTTASTATTRGFRCVFVP